MNIKEFNEESDIKLNKLFLSDLYKYDKSYEFIKNIFEI